MASVGGIDVTTFGGRMPYPQIGVGVIPGPAGVAGDGVIISKKKTSVVTIPTGYTLAGDYAAGEALAVRYRALATPKDDGIPNPVDVVDQFSRLWVGCRILSVIANVTLLAITNQVRVDCVWTFKVPVNNPQN
jgi:hypothetical protein